MSIETQIKQLEAFMVKYYNRDFDKLAECLLVSMNKYFDPAREALLARLNEALLALLDGAHFARLNEDFTNAHEALLDGASRIEPTSKGVITMAREAQGDAAGGDSFPRVQLATYEGSTLEIIPSAAIFNLDSQPGPRKPKNRSSRITPTDLANLPGTTPHIAAVRGTGIIEQHCTISEAAELLHLSIERTRQLFMREPGVLRIKPEGKPAQRMAYRIPESVLQRILRRCANPG